MKTYEELKQEAQSVLESVGDLVKRSSIEPVGSEELQAVSSLADSYARLYEEIQK